MGIAEDILADLRGIGLVLKVEEDKLLVGPTAAITDHARGLVQQHKPELLAALVAEVRRTSLTAPRSLSGQQQRTAIDVPCSAESTSTVPLDDAGFPCGLCRSCGGRVFWRKPRHKEPDAIWHCRVCAPIPNTPCDTCALPPG